GGVTLPFRYPFRGIPVDMLAFVQDAGKLHAWHTASTLREMCSSAGTGRFTYERARVRRAFAGPADTAKPGNPYGILDDPEFAFDGKALLSQTIDLVPVDGYGQRVRPSEIVGVGAQYQPPGARLPCNQPENDSVTSTGAQVTTALTNFQQVSM